LLTNYKKDKEKIEKQLKKESNLVDSDVDLEKEKDEGGLIQTIGELDPLSV
jgi:hypothetical protein